MDNDDDETVASLMAAMAHCFVREAGVVKKDIPAPKADPAPKTMGEGQLVNGPGLTVSCPSTEDVQALGSQLHELSMRTRALEASKPAPAAIELGEIQDRTRNLQRRVNSLEDSRRSVTCLHATLCLSGLMLVGFILLLTSTLVLAYAEHKWDVPVFTRIVKGR